MRGLSLLRGLYFSAAFVALLPGLAHAHAFIADPPSRDTAIADLDERAHKSGPCGGSPRTGMPTQLGVGAAVPVSFTETIGHRGCFQILFSPANDSDWVLLKQVDDPAGPNVGEPDKSYTETVTLPAGVSCQACTLAVRQLMKGVACEPNATAGATDTYYSCADIRVGDFPDAGPSRPPATSDAGATTSTGKDAGSGDGADGEDSSAQGPSGHRLSSVDAGDGCHVARDPSAVGSTLALAGLAALVVRARARRRAPRR